MAGPFLFPCHELLYFPAPTGLSDIPDRGAIKLATSTAGPFYFTWRIAGQANMPDDAAELGF
jgi:hypothetical protein